MYFSYTNCCEKCILLPAMAVKNISVNSNNVSAIAAQSIFQSTAIAVKCIF
jgi:hypothetical protein